MDNNNFMLHANSLNAIAGSLLHDARSGGVAHALTRCINHLYAQNMMLYREVVRLSDEINKMKEKENVSR